MLPERHTGCAGACQCGARVREGPGSAPVRSGVRRACLHPLCSRTGPCGRRARRKSGAGAPSHSAERSAGTTPSGKLEAGRTRAHGPCRGTGRVRAGRRCPMPRREGCRRQARKKPRSMSGASISIGRKADAGLIRLRRRELQLRRRAGLLLPPRDGRKRPSPARWPRCWRAGARARDDHPGYGWGRP